MFTHIELEFIWFCSWREKWKFILKVKLVRLLMVKVCLLDSSQNLFIVNWFFFNLNLWQLLSGIYDKNYKFARSKSEEGIVYAFKSHGKDLHTTKLAENNNIGLWTSLWCQSQRWSLQHRILIRNVPNCDTCDTQTKCYMFIRIQHKKTGLLYKPLHSHKDSNLLYYILTQAIQHICSEHFKGQLYTWCACFTKT